MMKRLSVSERNYCCFEFELVLDYEQPLFSSLVRQVSEKKSARKIPKAGKEELLVVYLLRVLG